VGQHNPVDAILISAAMASARATYWLLAMFSEKTPEELLRG